MQRTAFGDDRPGIRVAALALGWTQKIVEPGVCFTVAEIEARGAAVQRNRWFHPRYCPRRLRVLRFDDDGVVLRIADRQRGTVQIRADEVEGETARGRGSDRKFQSEESSAICRHRVLAGGIDV